MNQVQAQSIPQHSRLSVSVAAGSEELEQALRLRYRIFVEEEKISQLRNDSGLERDRYDDYCDHLIVKDEEAGYVVGTYRLLPGDRALAHEGFYSETEFDLHTFEERKPYTLELGRSCVHPDYRGGKAIQLLWEGIAAYISERPYSYLIGCASTRVSSLQELNLMYTMLHRKQMITDRYGITPLPSHRIAGLALLDGIGDDKTLFRALPPLMKGYQWLGAEIGGEPAYDEMFETVDYLIVLHKDRVTRKYKRHFLQQST